MPKTIEFFFDFVSPYSYIGWNKLPRLRAASGAEVEIKPMFLGGVMQATGNSPPGMVAAKSRYMMSDLNRCAEDVNAPFHMNPSFPMNTLRILRAALGFQDDTNEQLRFIDACFKHAWGIETPKNLGEKSDIAAMCAAEGFDADSVLAMGSDESLKAALTANTEDAVARGAFGAPTLFVGDEMFFGTDRFDFVAAAARS